MIGLSPLLERDSTVPLYKQLYVYIRHQIESGKLQRNEKLPSIRELSTFLLLSKNTIELAYQQLIAEGYVQSRPRSGLFVLALEPVMEMVPMVCKKDSQGGPGQQERPPLIADFQYGDVELERFPLAIWRKCLMDALRFESRQVLGYGHIQGQKELRVQIARYLQASRGVECDADRLFLASGTQQAISLLCQLLPQIRVVGMEEPGYDGVRTVLANHRLTIVPIPVEADGLSVEALRRSRADAVYVTPAHQFPLGGVLPVGKRRELLQWAEETGGLVIEGDYDSEFRYQGQPIPALKAMDALDRTIYLGTFSKSFMPAMRLSYMVLPERLAGDFRARLESYSQSVSPLLQQALFLFMKDGHYERHVRKTRKSYQARHRTLLHVIHREMGERVGVIGQKSGLHMLLDVYGRESGELVNRALEHGIRVYAPSRHWMNPEDCPDSYVMLGFGGLEEERISESIGWLKQAWFDNRA